MRSLGDRWEVAEVHRTLQIPRPEERTLVAPGQSLGFAVGIRAGHYRQRSPPAVGPAPAAAILASSKAG